MTFIEAVHHDKPNITIWLYSYGACLEQVGIRSPTGPV